MNSLIALWQDITTIQLVVTLLIVSNVASWRAIAKIMGKYHLLNVSNIRLWDRVDPDMVDDHYSGEYSIRRRARSAASKVLHDEGRSKAAKTRRGSALTQNHKD